MIYVMSGIHGEFEKYEEALEKIHFSDDDSLFVCGDVVDFGSRSMDILLDMMYRVNVYPIMGDHDDMARKYLTAFHEGLNGSSMADFESAAPGVVDWIKDQGGQATLEDFMRLEKSQKEQIAEFLADFELYEEVTVKGQHYVLVHGGIADFDAEKEMDEYTKQELVYSETDYQREYFSDSILITGGTLTSDISGHEQDRVFRGNRHLAVNCDCYGQGILAVVCLDNGKEYYVDS